MNANLQSAQSSSPISNGNAEVDLEVEEEYEWGVDLRADCEKILKEPHVETLFTLLILGSVVRFFIETDGASEQGPANVTENPKPPLWLHLLNNIVVVIFFLEMCARMFIMQKTFFTLHSGHFLDFVLVSFDVVTLVAELVLEAVPRFGFLRLARVFRVARLYRVTSFFPELNFMIKGIFAAFSSIFWGCILMVLVLLILAILAVQVLHPLNREVAATGEYDDCPRCLGSYSTVWHALVTLTLQLVIGDDFGTLVIPLIELNSFIYAIYIIALAIINMAVMNLILASIVDSGQATREQANEARHLRERAAIAKENRNHTEALLKICKDNDEDQSGTMSLDELYYCYDKSAEFRNTMNALEFTRMELALFFGMIDRTKSGSVDYREVVALLERSKFHNIHPMVVFTKYAVMDMWSDLRDHRSTMNEMIATLSELPQMSKDVAALKTSIKTVERVVTTGRRWTNERKKATETEVPPTSPASHGLRSNEHLTPRGLSSMPLQPLSPAKGKKSPVQVTASAPSFQPHELERTREQETKRKTSEARSGSFHSGLLTPDATPRGEQETRGTADFNEIWKASSELVNVAKEMLLRTADHNQVLSEMRDTSSCLRETSSSINGLVK